MRGERYELLMSPAEKRAFRAAARLEGLNLAAWIRRACRDAAEAERALRREREREERDA